MRKVKTDDSMDDSESKEKSKFSIYDKLIYRS